MMISSLLNEFMKLNRKNSWAFKSYEHIWVWESLAVKQNLETAVILAIYFFV